MMKQNEMILCMATPQKDFTNIRILIQQCIASKNVEFDNYISRIVHDAKAIVESSSNILKIDPEMFYYSIYLGEKGRSWVDQINPDNLKKEDYQKILEVFETL